MLLRIKMIDKGKKYSVGFLFDEDNDWISNFFSEESLPFKDKYDYTLSSDKNVFRNFDIVFILGYTKILDSGFLDKNDLNMIVHESDLPRGRGYSPVQWQILEGKDSIPISLFEADLEIDSGEIISKDILYLDGSELYEEIREKQAEATKKIIKEFLNKYPIYERTKQKGKETVYRKRNVTDSELDVNASIKDQFQLLRIVNNDSWPAFFYLKGKKYYLKIMQGDD
tara:strand:+ start:2678 stop:3355 length:678 start_codon:yes stop_codon:yes gene_type:complete